MAGVRIGSNIGSLMVQRHLGDATASVSRASERLSSGQRINAAADDAASLSIADKLNVDRRVYTQAVRNGNDMLSVLSIAQSALTELQTISIRQRELAAQSANSVYLLQQRQSMNEEAEALTQEFQRIVESTSFNGQKLLDLSSPSIRVQLGYGLDGSIEVALGTKLARKVGDSLFDTFLAAPAPASGHWSEVGDLNNDGRTDLVVGNDWNALIIELSNGDGTFVNAQVMTASVPTSFVTSTITLGDFNNDDKVDILTGFEQQVVFLGNGDGTFQAEKTALAVGVGVNVCQAADFNQDGILDLATSGGASFNLHIGHGDGTFTTVASYAAAGDDFSPLVVSDFNGDGLSDVAATSTSGALSVYLGQKAGFPGEPTELNSLAHYNYTALTSQDFNNDGKTDLAAATSDLVMELFFGNGDGSFRSSVTKELPLTFGFPLDAADINNDGLMDLSTADLNGIASIFINKGDGSFENAKTFWTGASGSSLSPAADFNGDGVMEFFEGQMAVICYQDTFDTTSIPHLNLNTRQGALDAMSVIDANMARLSSELGAIGAMQSRLETAISTLQNSHENIVAAESRIRDTDVAHESAELLRNSILQQSAIAVLGQVNQAPQVALSLLRGF